MLQRRIGWLTESHLLAELRDTLLPKLVSGQIRVREAEQMVESV
jgi:type I restriction enzyme S subunit